MNGWNRDLPSEGETPLLPAEWEKLCLSATKRLIDREDRRGGGTDLVDVRLDGEFPTTALVVVLARGERSGERRWELYRPWFLMAPVGRLPTASGVAWNISLYCLESAGRIYGRTPAAHVRDCFEICAPTIDTVPELAPSVVRLFWDEGRRIVVELRVDGRSVTVAVECFENGSERPDWVVAEDFRAKLLNLTSS